MLIFDNYYSTHSPENKYFSELIFNRLQKQAQSSRKISSRPTAKRQDVAARQVHPRHLPAMQSRGPVRRFLRSLRTTYQPTELINPDVQIVPLRPSARKASIIFSS